VADFIPLKKCAAQIAINHETIAKIIEGRQSGRIAEPLDADAAGQATFYRERGRRVRWSY
jgi:hypothetical protein